jgi:hypothetical protein
LRQKSARLTTFLEGNILSKLLFALFILLLTLSCAAEEPARAQSNPESELLPNAPQPQPVSFEVGFSRELLYHNVGNVLPDRPPASLKRLEGTRVKLRLITPVSSKSPNGSSFQASIEEPVAAEGRVLLPQGTLFEGHVESKRARRMMRPGSVYLAFDRLVFPNGDVRSVNLHLVSADSTAIKADAEGMLHPTLSKKRLAIQVGGAALTAKLADDLAELAGGTAVGAGTARLIGAGAAATFLVLQKGREVKLRPGDMFEAEFDSFSERILVN